MPYQNLLVEVSEKVAVIKLNHPPVNSISSALLEDLDSVLNAFGNDDDIRSLIITGAGGKAFSGGADITGFGRKSDKPAISGHDVFWKIENYPKPVIAAINGFAFGGGCELAMSCHLRIAAQEARFGQPEVKIGIIPGWGGTQRLPRLIGKTKAMELMLTGDPISAGEALQLGLVSRVVPGEELLTESRALAGRLANGPAVAIKGILTAVTRGLEVPLAEGLEIEQEWSALVFASEDAREGPRAFLEKRPPQFVGR